MLKKLLVAILLVGCSVFAFSQAKPKLGILPFTGGGGGDGETIAQIFSMQKEISDAFTVVPRRTNAVNALIAEQKFQMTGYTDSDTIARLGRFLNADFVVSGHIRRLGNSNLIIATIVNVETFEQMAGDYRVYQNIEEVRNLLPAISGKLIAASQRDTSRLPKLAIAPFSVANTGVNMQDAETLAQILAIEITNTGKYAVLPRTTTLRTALQELEYQMSGYTTEEGAKALGRAINANFVLSAEARSLGNMNMFTAQILHVEDGSLLIGDIRDYRIVDDGVKLMAELALFLTDQKNASAHISARNRELIHTSLFRDPSKFWSVGISAGTSFAAPWVIGTVHGTLAPLRYSYLEIGLDFGMISGIKDVDYYALYPYMHYALFIPFAPTADRQNVKGGWYIGAGGTYMVTKLDYPEGTVSQNFFAGSFTTGFNIRNMFDISYTLRTDFKTAENKISMGYTYRFK
jgi:TolB-like protein